MNTTLGEPASSVDVDTRVATIDWASAATLDSYGWAMLKTLLTADECEVSPVSTGTIAGSGATSSWRATVSDAVSTITSPIRCGHGLELPDGAVSSPRGNRQSLE
jgi:hypothetical protein